MLGISAEPIAGWRTPREEARLEPSFVLSLCDFDPCLLPLLTLNPEPKAVPLQLAPLAYSKCV